MDIPISPGLTRATPAPLPHSRLSGRRLLLARFAWTAGLLVLATMYALGIVAVHDALSTVCEVEPCTLRQQVRHSSSGDQILYWPGPPIGYANPLRPAQVEALARHGVSLDMYGWLGALQVGIPTLLCLLIAAALYWRKSDDWMVLFASVMVATFPVSNQVLSFTLAVRQPAWEWVFALGTVITLSSLLIFPLIFPNGRPVPRWTGRAALLEVAAALVVTTFRNAIRETDLSGGFTVACLLAGFGIGVYAQLYRYFRVANPVERQQLKWVIVGLAGFVSISVGVLVPLNKLLASSSAGDSGVSALIVASIPHVLFQVIVLFIPISLAVSVMRYRLWDIDFLFNRAVVYGALTATVVGLYVFMVGAMGAVFQAQGSVVLAIPATGLVALLFQPLRDRLQRAVNRVMYGERDDPYAVLARLGGRLEAALAPGVALPTIVQTVRDALRLPYAAIALKRDDGFVVAAAAGVPAGNPLQIALTYQGDAVGQLIVAPRAPGERFTSGDMRLLNSLAQQAGAAVHTVRLTMELQRARERLVTAREEERRRLRRDLHDGLGPNLASQGLKLAAARQFLAGNPGRAAPLLDQVIAQNEATVDDIRRLVYNLRPPALDERGLVAAIRDLLAGTAGSTGANLLRVRVETPAGDLPELPAAVEVAAYRIALEAMTNAMRHAGARRCEIRFSVAGNPDDASQGARLRIEIIDDGAGLREPVRAGVGLRSMRERAEELGGTLLVQSVAGGGTRVLAELLLGEAG